MTVKILITGGNGFIAKSLSETLTEYDVISCARSDLELLDSKAVKEYLKKHQFDVVIHTATYDAAPACSIKDPKMVLENNLRMFFNLARCQADFGKMIYFGSGAELDREHWIPKMKEDYFDQYVPQDPYGFSKYVMTKYALASENIFNLRLFGLFGKYDDWRYRFIPSACVKALFDKPITINQNKLFDYMYIDDLIKIVKWFLTHQPTQHVYNICTGKSLELKVIAEEIVKISGKDLEVIVKHDGLAKEYSGDNGLLLSEMNDFKLSHISNAISDLYSWYDLNRSMLDVGGVL